MTGSYSAGDRKLRRIAGLIAGGTLLFVVAAVCSVGEQSAPPASSLAVQSALAGVGEKTQQLGMEVESNAGGVPMAIATPTAAPTRTSTPEPTGGYYSSCKAARAAGVTPLYRGEPGYRSGLDEDSDGVACESK